MNQYWTIKSERTGSLFGDFETHSEARKVAINLNTQYQTDEFSATMIGGTK